VVSEVSIDNEVHMVTLLQSRDLQAQFLGPLNDNVYVHVFIGLSGLWHNDCAHAHPP
jgi:hypothetical protein